MVSEILDEKEGFEKYVQKTETPQGEIDLYRKFLLAEQEGLNWFEHLKNALVEGPSSNAYSLVTRDLVQKILALVDTVLVPQMDNFTDPKRTPWGGYKIVEDYKKVHGIQTKEIVGESWEISGHPSFPNRFTVSYFGKALDVPIGVLESLVPEKLYGADNIEQFGPKMPFLVKFLNSGSWNESRHRIAETLKAVKDDLIPDEWKRRLEIYSIIDILRRNNHDLHQALTFMEEYCEREECSPELHAVVDALKPIHQEMILSNLSVQVHPKKGDYPDKPSKTEAWVILEADKGAGIYLGLKPGVDQETFEEGMRNGADVSDHLNFIEVKSGDVYFIPSGTMHAIGAGIVLVEPQETSETTFRAYDWGRLYHGSPRELHLEETSFVTSWDDVKGEELVNKLRQDPREISGSFEGEAFVQSLVDVPEFKHRRIRYSRPGERFIENDQGFRTFIVVEGAVAVENGKRIGLFRKGQSFLLPASVGKCTISSQKPCTVVLETRV